MTTITLWLLIAVSGNTYPLRGTVTTIGQFTNRIDCETVSTSIQEMDKVRLKCIQATVVK